MTNRNITRRYPLEGRSKAWLRAEKKAWEVAVTAPSYLAAFEAISDMIDADRDKGKPVWGYAAVRDQIMDMHLAGDYA